MLLHASEILEANSMTNKISIINAITKTLLVLDNL